MSRELSGEFLECVLREYENDDTIVIRRLEIRNAVPAGENFVSDVKQVSVEGFRFIGNKNEDFLMNLIVKLLHNNPVTEGLLPFKDLFKNEMIAYNDVIPELKKYTSDGTLPVAECIYADESVVIMKNLITQGYNLIDKHKGFHLKQIENILKAMAKLHSASMVMSVKAPNKFKDISQSLKEVLYDSAGEVLKATQGLRTEIAIRIFEELDDISEKEKIIHMLKNLKNHDTRSLILEERPNRVLNHGDTWCNNILIRDDEVVLIDLQAMRYTSVAADLSYFLYVCVKPKARQENINQFLTVYLTALNENIAKAGCNLELAMDWLLEEMRDFSMIGLASALLFAPVFHYNREDLDINDINGDDFKTFDYQWKLVKTKYKESVIENVLEYMEMLK